MNVHLKRLLPLLCLMLRTFAHLNAQQENQLEQRFDTLLEKESIGTNIKNLSAYPHHLGSARGKEVAEEIYQWFNNYGWDVEIETFHVLFPTPLERKLELIEPTTYTAILKEPAVDGDASSSQEGQLPTYNAWGADGDVTAPLVFVNYGLPADYEQLERLGVDVKGKIVIAKYGNSWRGIKPKVAYEHGAVGCIIYSDPKEDGYYQGDGYPEGPFKNEHTVQRGSVMDMVLYPGDPLTPGIGATKEAKRLRREEATTILKIPVLPISYHDAQPLLAALDGPVAPDSWRGALPITYRLGGGKAKVHLKIKQSWDIVPAYNVIAKITGDVYPDQWVIRGNHHDAWVNGTDDPVSGLAALLEEAKAIGSLVKQGFRPKRTLIYCAWDGEEQSLLGSTEWVEHHADELRQKAVAYINSDGNSRGFFNAGGSHAFKALVTDISKEVRDPLTDRPVYDRKLASTVLSTSSRHKKQELLQQDQYALQALGTGSDYSAFLQHLGIPSLNFAFGGESSAGDYHSIYDSYDHYIRFKDPDFSYGVALSQAAGRAVLRISEANILPFDFRGLHEAIKTYAKEIKTQADELRQAYESENKLISDSIYLMAADPKKEFVTPKSKLPVPPLSFENLFVAIDSLGMAASQLAERQSNFKGDEQALSVENAKLFQAEKALLLPNGLPRRPWYKHSIYAPGFYTGYGVKTLPGVKEALEEGHYEELEQQMEALIGTIQNLTKRLHDIFV
ncbi:M28 family peptidase [Olivibacter sp. SDN3]|uniref:transferrin receptor-like dimerization domain-containing protein n=1 Tax=Olivibacter sp. SDN3 TaxID=2764720 RepID=UPI00165104BB|nr:transferrin receptor-like dimerization domain-containing protein [Olivibacter sp. SDN3]QNL49363.1 M28 family peptidase [Olivibacter sp. SDN3]